jgi:hypothetical protein
VDLVAVSIFLLGDMSLKSIQDIQQQG